MIINTVKINNSKLTEGKNYWFNIVKTLELDSDNKYYILEDPLGYKVLLPLEYYKDYKFKHGEKILCRVDKINCKGQMFVEPAHPYYKEKNVYIFRYVKSLERLNFFGQKEYIIVVNDIFDNTWEVKTSPGNHLVNSREVECYVLKIKKGKLFLKKVNDNMTSPLLKKGEYYDFSVIDEKINPDNGKRYLILEDKHKNNHILQKKHYLNHNIKKNQKITCRVDRISSEGYYYLEPRHPYYEPGKSYKFPAIRLDHYIFSNDKHQFTLVLEDHFGEEINIDLGEKIDDKLKDKEFLECKVKDIYKGKPVLEIT